MVVAEARRTYTYLSLFGYHVDAVIANRMLPDAIDDPWFARWKATQSAHLESINDAFRPLPVLSAELAERELVGLDDLAAFGAALYADCDPADRLADIEPLRVDAVGSSLVLSVHLPFTERDDVDLARSDDELFLTVGPHRRALVLPDSLLRREVAGARVRRATGSKWSSYEYPRPVGSRPPAIRRRRTEHQTRSITSGARCTRCSARPGP